MSFYLCHQEQRAQQEGDKDDDTLSQHSQHEDINKSADIAVNEDDEVVQMDRRASKSVDVKPYTTSHGKEIGLVVHNVEEGSYVDRVGELQTADRITEINGPHLIIVLTLSVPYS